MKSKYKKSILVASLGIVGLGNVSHAQTIAAGGWHSLAICSDSTVKAFGENASGQLGDGTTADKSTPVTVSGLSGIISVSGGGDQLEAHSMALKRNGTVWTWGSNIYGGLGNGTTNATMTPMQVLSLSGISAISAGGWHSVALKNDGTVWAWGDNVSGQIGDGTTTDKTSPVQVSGLSGVRAIAAGRFFSLAIKNDGTVWTWGENLYGQLGDGTVADKSTPVQVSGLTGVVDAVIASGAFHCMALKNNNTVWSWGRNTYGNLGDGTTTNISTPVQVSGITTAAGIAAGTNFTLLYKNDGTFWGCGRNASGQLGDGTVTQRNTFTQATGLCSILQPVGITKLGKDAFVQVKVFPNPSSDGKFTIEMPGGAFNRKGSKIEIYNAIGQKVIQSTADELMINASLNIDLSAQANGVYYLTMQCGEYMVNQKLMKQ